MKYAKFAIEKEARKHRSVWGGWLAKDHLEGWHWFEISMTPTKIITSPHLRGLSCILV